MQGDAKVDDAIGMLYCIACWLAGARHDLASWVRRIVRIPPIIQAPEISHHLAAFLYDGIWADTPLEGESEEGDYGPQVRRTKGQMHPW